MHSKKVAVVMGISGCGKTTIGQALARQISVPFLDADDFHPRENILKMSRGIPLEDEDRWPWLAAIAEYIKQSHREHFVLACSALRTNYRSFLNQGLDCDFYWLEIDKEEAIQRLSNRQGHFMKAELVDSQLDTLEVTTDLHRIDGTMVQDDVIQSIILNMK